MTGAWLDFNDALDQTRPKPEERLTSDDLKERLHGRLREALFHLLPQGKIRKGKFTVGDVQGNKLRTLDVASISILIPPEEKPEGWDVADAVTEGMDVPAFLGRIRGQGIGKTGEPKHQ